MQQREQVSRPFSGTLLVGEAAHTSCCPAHLCLSQQMSRKEYEELILGLQEAAKVWRQRPCGEKNVLATPSSCRRHLHGHACHPHTAAALGIAMKPSGFAPMRNCMHRRMHAGLCLVAGRSHAILHGTCCIIASSRARGCAEQDATDTVTLDVATFNLALEGVRKLEQVRGHACTSMHLPAASQGTPSAGGPRGAPHEGRRAAMS